MEPANIFVLLPNVSVDRPSSLSQSDHSMDLEDTTMHLKVFSAL